MAALVLGEVVGPACRSVGDGAYGAVEVARRTLRLHALRSHAAPLAFLAFHLVGHGAEYVFFLRGKVVPIGPEVFLAVHLIDVVVGGLGQLVVGRILAHE